MNTISVNHKGKKYTIEYEGEKFPTDKEIDDAVEKLSREQAEKPKAKKVSDVTAMVIDNGFYVDMARTLGRTFKKVYYCYPSWVNSEPDIRAYKVGQGFSEIEWVRSPFYKDPSEIDIYIFLDVGHQDMQNYFASIGKRVWGARNGEDLEFFREDLKALLKKVGLPVGPYEIVKGTPALREYLKRHDDQIVKVDIFRGLVETFKSHNYATVEFLLDTLDVTLGPYKNSSEFIVEEMLKNKREVGIDNYCIDGQYPSKTLYGIEVKDLGYAAEFVKYDDISAPVREVNEKLAPTLKNYKFRQFFSTEIRIGKDKSPYLIDLTPRHPSPPGELYQRFYKNIAEIIWEGANGNLIDPDPISKWGVEIILQCDFSKNCCPIEVPKEYQDNVFLKNSCRIGKETYFLPQAGQDLPQIGSIAAWSSTLKGALEMAREIGDSINGIFLDSPNGALEKAQAEIEKSKEWGLWTK